MAELTTQERLQPSLLDRLTDESPHQKQESREQRILSLRKLRDVVLRDLAWLLNCANLASVVDLEDVPQVGQSVLNYGIMDLTGATSSGLDVLALERRLRQSIWDFEPRILRQSVRVTVVAGAERMDHNALTFEIEGEMWAQPIPLRLYLKTEIDLETGSVRVTDTSGQGVR